jgi:hypothetical protein
MALSNSFKAEMRYHNRNLYLKDSGVGLGAWLMKRKIIHKADNSEMLLNIE